MSTHPDSEKNVVIEKQPPIQEVMSTTSSPVTMGSYDHTKRRLKNRHVQLIGIGGTIGTALFVQIGAALVKGGPASLFIAFAGWCTFILAINNCLSEMVTWMPISSPFVRYADRFVDSALGITAGINFFIFEAALVPYEVVACNVILQFWTDKIPTAAVIVFVLVTYTILNFYAVKFYGESEFWLASGKVLLAVGLILFTFITMVGGNPLREAYGFRFWKPENSAGAPFSQYIYTGDTGRMVGFMACLIQAAFTIAGPDYVSMTAGEATLPRKNLPRAFRSVFWRLTFFFVLGSLCVGIVVDHNDPNLLAALSDAKPGAGSSPYVIGMIRMGIPVLPHIVNFLVLTAVYSAGNSYVFCASRTLYGLALDGKAPRIFSRCNKNGVPHYAVALTLAIALVSFLQLSTNTAVVLQWLVSLVTASQLLNYAFISFTFIRYWKAIKAQGIDRNTLPYKSIWQPFCGYYGLVGTSVMAVASGYEVFLPGRWDVPTFLFSYTMIFVCPALFFGWKYLKGTTLRKPTEIDFFEKERKLTDQYEAEYVETEKPSLFDRSMDLICS